MNILFVDAIQYRAEGLLYKLEQYGPENACVVDFPTQSENYNGLAFIFRESVSLAQLSALVYHCYKDGRSTGGYFYNNLRYFVHAEQLIDLTPSPSDQMCCLGSKVFDIESSLLERKDYLEQILVSQGVIERFTSFTAPKEFLQELMARQGADYWGNWRG
ncbi:hypothetical protein SPB21_19060 [Leptothoe sp. ISB3NOV94-8A]